MHDDLVFVWTWRHWIALAIGAVLWIALFYLIGSFLYWVFFILR